MITLTPPTWSVLKQGLFNNLMSSFATTRAHRVLYGRYMSSASGSISLLIYILMKSADLNLHCFQKHSALMSQICYILDANLDGHFSMKIFLQWKTNL